MWIRNSSHRQVRTRTENRTTIGTPMSGVLSAPASRAGFRRGETQQTRVRVVAWLADVVCVPVSERARPTLSVNTTARALNVDETSTSWAQAEEERDSPGATVWKTRLGDDLPVAR